MQAKVQLLRISHDQQLGFEHLGVLHELERVLVHHLHAINCLLLSLLEIMNREPKAYEQRRTGCCPTDLLRSTGNGYAEQEGADALNTEGRPRATQAWLQTQDAQNAAQH